MVVDMAGSVQHSPLFEVSNIYAVKFCVLIVLPKFIVSYKKNT